jgi:hypothetical protein
MREIITIQIGQAGNSIGEKVRKLKDFVCKYQRN